jgi:hypothetical protein
MSEEAGEPLGLVAAQPGVEGVGIAWAKQAGAGDGMGGGAVGDLEQCGAAFADERLGIVVAVIDEFVALWGRERESTALGHRGSPLWFRYLIIAALPILMVKTH